MAWMTREAFEEKWGKSGVLANDGPSWHIAAYGNICVASFPLRSHASQYTGWDAYLTAVGCTPVDPRDAVFRAYGWSESEAEDGPIRWKITDHLGRQLRVRRSDGDCSHVCGQPITTAAQAEALCTLMGLSKVGG